jgi:uncharacterized protein (DUF4415 family)
VGGTRESHWVHEESQPIGPAEVTRVRFEVDETSHVRPSASACSPARDARASPSAARTARRTDFRDIPEASVTQLTAMRRVGRPPLGATARQVIAIRLDARVLARFRKEARRRGVGYQTLINEVLAEHVRKDVA